MNQKKLFRGLFYILGLLLLALGLTLNNKCGLGTSAMSTPAYFASLVCLVFTRVLNWMDRVVSIEPAQMGGKLLLLAAAILLTGIGVALNLNAKLIPNPGDGIIETLAQFFGKGKGITKNLFDLFCMTVTLVMGLVTGHFLWAVGIGTLLGVVGVGRVIAVFDRLCKPRLDRLTGLAPE